MVALFLFFVVFCIFVSKMYKRFSKRDLRYLFGVPFFLFTGYFCMSYALRIPVIDSKIGEGTNVVLKGEVLSVSASLAGQTVNIQKVMAKCEKGVLKVRGIVMVYGLSDTLAIGQQIQVTGLLKKVPPATNPGEFNKKAYYGAKNTFYLCYADDITFKGSSYDVIKESLSQLRIRLSSVYSSLLAPKEAGVVKAMVLGDKSGLDEELKSLYQQNGIAHILAISGLHVSFMGHTIFRHLRKKGQGYLLAAIISSLFLVFYCTMTGMSGSTFRAMSMLILAMTADVIGRSADMLTSLAFSGFLMLAANPLLLIDAGFLLSFGAMFGIATVYPILKAACCRYEVPLVDAFLVSLSIQVITIPVLIHYYYEIPIYAIFLNLVIIPLMSILLPFAVLGAMFGCISLFWGKIILFPAVVILYVYEWLCNIFSKLPGNMWVTGQIGFTKTIVYYIFWLIVLFLLYQYKYKIAIMAAVCFVVLLSFKPPLPLQIIYADVGQGDGIFIRSPSDTTYLIDGGSTDTRNVGKYRLLSMVKYYGVAKIDYIIVTHMDEDHISGIKELLDLLPIGQIVIPSIQNPDEAYHQFVKLVSEKGIVVKYLEKGMVLKDKSLELACLHPNKKLSYKDRNSYSTVLSLSYKGFKALFTGDLDEEGEKEIQSQLQEYHILKVAHHGSRFSTNSQFLEKVQPPIAVISCGKDNKYGHPHKELVDRLKEIDCQILTTPADGAIICQVYKKGNNVRVNITGFLHENMDYRLLLKN